MCDVCCEEFGGWCKAFTRTERLLSLLECILLLVFIGFLTFLILHLIVCPKDYSEEIVIPSTNVIVQITTTKRSTLDPAVQCTWKPSQKTRATTHYYENDKTPVGTTENIDSSTASTSEMLAFHTDLEPQAEGIETWEGVEETDGEEPEADFEKFVMGLVKIKPMRDVTFGCILTVVAERWALTAASCLDAVEEVDSLDAFVMLAGPGAGPAHAVSDVRVHPLYAGGNRSYDVAALRSVSALLPRGASLPRLPDMLDYLLLTIGERLSILGYGSYRSVEASAWRRGVREARVYRLPASACRPAPAGPLRHLARPAPLSPAACLDDEVCAGPLHERGLACQYCAGTPLLAGRVLLALMAAGAGCGDSCEPAAYVNLAARRDWIDAVIYSGDDQL